MKLLILTLCCFCASLTMTAKAEIPKSITLAAADWCPYTCPSNENPGIVVEYLQQILTPYNITLDIQYLPWSRALEEVDTGRISGLVTAVPSEAPALLFTSEATMNYNVCLYSRISSNWQYTDPSSLKKHVLGAALNYSYDEDIDLYIQKTQDSGTVTLITGNHKVFRFTSMLLSNRIDTFIGDKYVTGWEAKNENIDMQEIKINQCLQSHPFYFALNPSLPWSKELVDLLDKNLSLEKNRTNLLKIINKYTAQ